MRPTSLLATCLIALGIGGAAIAEDGPVILELYTSQGCASCPPADAMLRDLAGREDVIALALHVDYWDYIGWADSFADPAFSNRQKSYAAVAGERTVYTPQIVIGGRDHVVGARPGEVSALLAAHATVDSGVDLELERDGANHVRLSARTRAAFDRPVVVQLVRYDPYEDVAIRRGENAGHTFRYMNIVTDWQRVGEWDGRASLELRLRAPGPQPVVVILQEQGPGVVLAAGRLR
ncbi:MAG: putative secreted protein [Rhodobacteraceae bacterium HLUCCA08]|nr:MAG: putative secreted protein [Rhodobacteraceae bacterium HLUCCA08]